MLFENDVLSCDINISNVPKAKCIALSIPNTKKGLVEHRRICIGGSVYICCVEFM